MEIEAKTSEEIRKDLCDAAQQIKQQFRAICEFADSRGITVCWVMTFDTDRRIVETGCAGDVPKIVYALELLKKVLLERGTPSNPCDEAKPEVQS